MQHRVIKCDILNETTSIFDHSDEADHGLTHAKKQPDDLAAELTLDIALELPERPVYEAVESSLDGKETTDGNW